MGKTGLRALLCAEDRYDLGCDGSAKLIKRYAFERFIAIKSHKTNKADLMLRTVKDSF